jgi:predicted outer membrane repeat protein
MIARLIPFMALLAACGDKDPDPGDVGGPPLGGDTDADIDTDTDTDADTDADTDTDAEDVDADGDGAVAGDDCDDADPAVHPGADELCNGADDDCDGEVDEDDAVDAPIWYVDADGDGYGDPDSAFPSCDTPTDGIAAAGDCNDASARAYPGAVEICDGGLTDCDDAAWTTDAGMVTFIDAATGAASDWSGVLLAGGTRSVQALTLDTAGTLTLCEGTWPVSLTVEADVAIEGAGGRDAVVLSGGDSATVVKVQQDGLDVSLAGLTIQDGLATEVFDESESHRDLGGGVHCRGSSSLTLTDVGVHENWSDDYGAGVGARGCAVSFVDSSLGGNTSDGGFGELTVVDGTLDISGGDFSDATLRGRLVLVTGVSSVVVEDSTFSNLTGEGVAFSPYGALRAGGSVTAVLRRTAFHDIELDRGHAIEGGSWTALQIEDSSFERVDADDGACLYADGVDIDITGTTFDACTSTDGYSGGIYAEYSSLSIAESSFSACSGTDGAAVTAYDAEGLAISDTLFADNTSAGSGGGLSFVMVDDAVAALTDVEFTDNTAQRGGAVFGEGAMTLDGGDFDGNSASATGGALYLDGGELQQVTNSSFTNHTATRGAALFVDETSMALSLSTLADNVATSEGGGIYISGSDLDAVRVDFSGNGPSDTFEDTDGDAQDWGLGANFSCESGRGCR